VPSNVLNQALAITITWLVVSVITVIDPASGERTSSVTSLLGVIRGTKPT
jgi:hypothetical protein